MIEKRKRAPLDNKKPSEVSPSRWNPKLIIGKRKAKKLLTGNGIPKIIINKLET